MKESLKAEGRMQNGVRSLEQTLLLGMARDNAEIAASALRAGMPEMARANLLKAIEEIDLAESMATPPANTQAPKYPKTQALIDVV